MIILLTGGETEILTNQIAKNNEDIINKPPRPLWYIKLTKESKIIGHLTTFQNNANENAEFRLIKEKAAWGLTKYSSITNKILTKHYAPTYLKQLPPQY